MPTDQRIARVRLTAARGFPHRAWSRGRRERACVRGSNTLPAYDASSRPTRRSRRACPRGRSGRTASNRRPRNRRICLRRGRAKPARQRPRLLRLQKCRRGTLRRRGLPGWRHAPGGSAPRLPVAGCDRIARSASLSGTIELDPAATARACRPSERFASSSLAVKLPDEVFCSLSWAARFLAALPLGLAIGDSPSATHTATTRATPRPLYWAVSSIRFFAMRPTEKNARMISPPTQRPNSQRHLRSRLLSPSTRFSER